jgi:hypothetical protein
MRLLHSVCVHHALAKQQHGMSSAGCSYFDPASSGCRLSWCPCALQAQGVGGRPVKYSGMADVFRQTYSNEGLRGFYKVREASFTCCLILQPGCLRAV